MSILKTLKLSDQTQVKSIAAPEVRRRAKLLTNIERQIKAAEAAIKGELYTFEDFRYVTNKETGERVRTSAAVKVKTWSWKNLAGVYFLCIKYGNKKLEFSKGKFAIEVGKQEDLIPTLNQIAEAVKTGELDDCIASVAKFGSKIK